MNKLIKVVKEGKLPNKIYIGTCSHCDCQVEAAEKIEYDPRNIKYISEGRHYAAHVHGVAIYCPTTGCKKIIVLMGVIKK